MSKQPAWRQWHQVFKKNCPQQYEMALKIAKDPVLKVTIFATTDTGGKLWVIAPVDNLDFGLAGFANKREAERFCKEIGWSRKW